MDAVVSKPVYTVQVRELVEFVLRRGDLGGASRFVGSDRALAGIRGHQKIQRSRPPGYLTEIPVDFKVETNDFILSIRGRIDGLLSGSGEVLVEEIKTIQGIWDKQADPLHWAQAKFYAFFYATDHNFKNVVVQLTYLELETGQMTELREAFTIEELDAFFNEAANVYVAWLRELQEWRELRNHTIRHLAFPFAKYRPGQRELAVAVYRALVNGGRLFLAAPTGIGKTISALFPAVKALGEGKIERVFYLTARTIGRTVAEKALADLRQVGLKLRAVTLTAKEKVCVRDGQPCDAATCPLANGYYDRVKPAIRAALAREAIDRSTLEAVGQAHQVCPFELSLDVSLWADAVICDYNYVFDPRVYLRRHFSEEEREYAFLVDEAHNLVDRAREMFSAALETREILTTRRALRQALPRCAKALMRLSTGMRKLANRGASPDENIEASDPALELNLFAIPAANERTSIRNRGRALTDAAMVSTTALREFPAELSDLIEDAMEQAEIWLARNQPAPFRDDLLTLYFQLFAFRRTADLYDERFVTIVQADASVSVRLFCVDPSFLLLQALARGKAAVFFSATLTPVDYYRHLLGGCAKDPVLQLHSPFSPEHLAVFIHDRIQTHLKARTESLEEVAQAIEALVQSRSGNYLIYFPSYQYLNDVRRVFQAANPSVKVLAQTPGMTESERETFLAAFSLEHTETLAGFAVLGGIFGEGIDLMGDRLIGAVIVGVGLPQLCIERDLVRDYFQERNARGFDYAYTFPGMNRVLQAVGRVIRSETDRGVVLLIDSRFNEMRYRRLFPPWWQFLRVRHPDQLCAAVASFWNDSKSEP